MDIPTTVSVAWTLLSSVFGGVAVNELHRRLVNNWEKQKAEYVQLSQVVHQCLLDAVDSLSRQLSSPEHPYFGSIQDHLDRQEERDRIAGVFREVRSRFPSTGTIYEPVSILGTGDETAPKTEILIQRLGIQEELDRLPPLLRNTFVSQLPTVMWLRFQKLYTTDEVVFRLLVAHFPTAIVQALKSEMAPVHTKMQQIVERIDSKQSEINRVHDKKTPFVVGHVVNDEFVNREQVISEIDSALKQGRLVVLTGSAGIGKTQIAVQYAHRYQESYPDGIVLVDTKPSVQKGFANLHPILFDQPEVNSSDEIRALDVAKYFENRERALIILDDLSNIAQLRQSMYDNYYKLVDFKCRILVTQNNTDTVLPGINNLEPINVGNLDPVHSVKMILQAYKKGAPSIEENELDVLDAHQIATDMEHYPLALFSVCYLLQIQRYVSLRECRAKLQEQPLEELQESEADDTGLSPTGHRFLLATFQQIHDSLPKAAKDLLTAISIFPNNAIYAYPAYALAGLDIDETQSSQSPTRVLGELRKSYLVQKPTANKLLLVTNLFHQWLQQSRKFDDNGFCLRNFTSHFQTIVAIEDLLALYSEEDVAHQVEILSSLASQAKDIPEKLMEQFNSLISLLDRERLSYSYNLSDSSLAAQQLLCVAQNLHLHSWGDKAIQRLIELNQAYFSLRSQTSILSYYVDESDGTENIGIRHAKLQSNGNFVVVDSNRVGWTLTEELTLEDVASVDALHVIDSEGHLLGALSDSQPDTASDTEANNSGRDEETLVVWSAATNSNVLVYSDEPIGIEKCIAISSNGEWMVASPFQSGIKRWHILTASAQDVLTQINGIPIALAISSDGRFIFAAMPTDPKIYVWNEQEGEVPPLSAHTRPITALTLSADASYLASAGEEGEIHIWDMSTMESVKTLRSSKSNVTHMSMGADEDAFLVKVNDDHIIQLWDWKGRYPHLRDIQSKRFNVDLRYVDALNTGRLPTLLYERFKEHGFSLSSQARVEVELAKHRWRVVDVNKLYLIQREGRKLVVYDRSRPSGEIARLSLAYEITSLEIAADNSCITAGDAQGNIFVWDVVIPSASNEEIASQK